MGKYAILPRCGNNSIVMTAGTHNCPAASISQKTAIARKVFSKAVAAVSAASFFFASVSPLQADPAPNITNFSLTTPGVINTTVPDGTCAIAVTGIGANGGSSSAGTITTGGLGGGGASISARFNVVPLQTVSGAVGQGGQLSNGGTGFTGGGAGGTGTGHRGAGGGGSTALVVGGTTLLVAGAGGGGAAAHQVAGSGGTGGFAGIAPGVVAPGGNGAVGFQTGSVVNGGQGGQALLPGTGGLFTPAAVPSYDGFPGVGGVGGNGGVDQNLDTGGGGGGGFTGGGGGASTSNSSVTGGGGGAGSSFLVGNSPVTAAPVRQCR